MANKTWTGTGTNDNFNQADHWDGSTLPSAGDNLTISGSGRTCTVTADEANTYGTLTVDSGVILDLTTKALTVGAATINGTLKIGNSGAGSGFTCSAWTQPSGSTGNFQVTSKINVGGNISIDTGATWTNNPAGLLTITGNGNIINTNSNKLFYRWTINSGVTTTMTSTTRLSNANSDGFDLNGTINTANAAYTLSVGMRSAGNCTIGANGDISGPGTISWANTGGGAGTFTCAKTSAFSHTGTNGISGTTGSNVRIPPGNWSNSTTAFTGGGSATTYVFFDHTTFGTVTLTQNSNANQNFSNAGNYNITFNKNVNLKQGTGTYTVGWTKGTGTITLADGSGTNTIYLGTTDAVEDIVVNSAGVVKQFTTANVTTDSITVTAGTLDIQTLDVTSSGITSVTGTLKIGTSATNGLTTAGLTMVSGGKLDLQTGSIIKNSSNFTGVASWQTTDYRGTYTQTGSGNYNATGDQHWYSFTQNASTTMTISGSGEITDKGSTTTVLNGTVAVGSNSVYFGSLGTGTVTLGANALFTGTGLISWDILSGATVTDSAGTFTFTGTWEDRARTAANYRGWARDLTGIDYRAKAAATGGTIIPTAGTLKCKKFDFAAAGAYTLTYNASTNNPSFESTGDVTFTDGNITLTYTKGTGSRTASGGNANLNYDSKSIESLTVNTSGTKTATANFTTVNLTLDGGIFNPNAKTITLSGNFDINAGSMADSTSTLVLTGTSKTFTANAKSVDNVTLDTGASYTFGESVTMDNFSALGTGTFDDTKSYTVNDISGNGILQSGDADTATITYNGANTFSGTLTRVLLVSSVAFAGAGQPGIGMGLRIGL